MQRKRDTAFAQEGNVSCQRRAPKCRILTIWYILVKVVKFDPLYLNSQQQRWIDGREEYRAYYTKLACGCFLACAILTCAPSVWLQCQYSLGLCVALK